MEPEHIRHGMKTLGKRLRGYGRYKAYYDGEHRLAFATDRFKSLFSKMFVDFADNMCPTVVDAVTDRLQLLGMDIPKDVPGAAGLEVSVQEIWEHNRMDQRAGEVHQEAATTGDAYLVVWPDPEYPALPVLYPNCAENMTVYYDEDSPGKVVWALKTWLMLDGRRRVTMYYPDRLERYVTPQKVTAWSQVKPEGLVEWEVDPVVQNPYGQVPVFHFQSNARTGQFGRSELQGVLPLQDALNKALQDMLVAMEFVALPQRWVTGLELKFNPLTGKLEWPFEAGVDRIWAVDDPAAKFGEFAAANLEHFLKTQDGFRLEIARVSRTPLHYTLQNQGDWPSGESLKTAEAPFTAKIRDRMAAFGNTWEDAFRFALRVHGTTPPALLAARWADPAPSSTKEQAETMAVDATLPAPMLRRRGYTDDEILEIVRSQTASIGGAVMDQFTNGGM